MKDDEDCHQIMLSKTLSHVEGRICGVSGSTGTVGMKLSVKIVKRAACNTTGIMCTVCLEDLVRSARSLPCGH
ncbi:hypothetical protein Tsubulata_026026, partial [Turnera subulata]